MKALAASFVVTVGLMACGPAPAPTSPDEPHRNPPGPTDDMGPEPPHQNPPGPVDDRVPEDDADDETADGGAADPRGDEGLPTASPGATVDKHADGTCWLSHDWDCPPGKFCNPPPPQRVACPAD
jgi:hypothetical protein